MPFLLPFHRASTHEKVVQIIAYPIAIVLGIAVVAPLAVMAVNSFGDITDAQAGISMPASLKRYLGSDPFYIRYLHQRYEGLPEMALNHWYPEHYAPPADNPGISITDLISKVTPPEGNWKQQARDARECMAKGIPWNFKELLFLSWTWNPLSMGEVALACSGKLADDWSRYLARRYKSVAGINREFGTAYRTLHDIPIPTTLSLENENAYMLGTPLMRAWKDYLGTEVDSNLVTLLSSDLDFAGFMNGIPATGGSLEKVNSFFGTNWKDWHDVILPESAPVLPAGRNWWEYYLKNEVNPYILEIINPAKHGAEWTAFLLKVHGSLGTAAAAWGMSAAPAIPPATLEAADATEPGFHDWSNFARSLPGPALRARTPEGMWRKFLREKYGTPEALASAWNLPTSADFATVLWPQVALDRAYYEEHKLAIILEGLFHNYRRAWIMIASATPALWNTLRYTGLALLLCLLLNTGIAYCLARFKFPPLQMSLAYFLALSAFPIEAMAIPNFILLRHIGLLNTVWALALPTAVNGYFIYLLKSAFEGIPPSWFEQAQIEGASEWQLFLKVGLPAASPMIAVVALYGFMYAWSNFLWAMIVGESREMWTMPVLIFSMHNWETAPSIISAALVIMTLPPLLIFILANRTVQRGLTAKSW